MCAVCVKTQHIEAISSALIHSQSANINAIWTTTNPLQLNEKVQEKSDFSLAELNEKWPIHSMDVQMHLYEWFRR